MPLKGLQVWILATIAPMLWGGEYSVWSPGLKFGMARATGSTFIAFQSSSGNIQGAKVAALYGVSLANQVRLGELASWRLRGVVLVPTLGFHLGREKEYQENPNLVIDTGDGARFNVAEARSRRTTETREISLAVPVRWYVSTGSAVYGGFYVQAGPMLVRTEQTVELQVNGIVDSLPASRAESTQSRATEQGFLVGLGTTKIYRGQQFTYGLDFQMISGDVGSRVASNQIQAHLTWTF